MTAIQLDPVAVTAAPLLRAIAKGGWATRAELAQMAGRDRKNMARDLKTLSNAGLATVLDDETGIVLTDHARAQLDAIDRAEGGEGKPGSPNRVRFPEQVGDIQLLPHGMIFPDRSNARRDWDSDEAKAQLDALRQDIIQIGLLQNLVVRRGLVVDGQHFDRNDDGDPLQAFTLVGGERRWRAIGLAIADDDWPADRPIPCRVIDVDALGQRLAALSENLQRRNLNPLEKARAFDGLAQAFADQGVEDGKINREIADRVGVTIEHVQQHRAFLKLDDADQQRLTLPKDDPRRLSVSDARKKLSAKAAAQDRWNPASHPTDEQLILAELLVAYRDRGTYFGGVLPVDPAILQDSTAERLADLNIINLPAGPADGWNFPGHHVVSFRGWTFSDALRDCWPALTDADEITRHDALRDLQSTLVGRASDGLTFLTPWLNGPFALSPEGQVIADKAAADAKARDQAEQDRQASIQQRDHRWNHARQRHLRLMALAEKKPHAGAPSEITNIAGLLDRPLPWTLLPSGVIVAANAAIVRGRQGPFLDHDLAIGQMIVVAANAAANHPTPAIPTAATEDDEPEQDIDGNDPGTADEDEAEEGEAAERAYAAADHEDAA